MKNLRCTTEVEKEKAALFSLKGGYIVTPRNLLKLLFDEQEITREVAKLYLALYLLCCYEETTVILRKKAVKCRKGELFTNYTLLGGNTQFSNYKLKELLNRLVNQGLIKITRLRSGVLIYLYGYDELTCPGKNKKGEEMELSPFQQMMNYEQKIAKGIRC